MNSRNSANSANDKRFKDLYSQATKRELAWSSMLPNDEAKQVYAPSLSPELLCKATFVKSKDVSYNDTVDGYSIAVLTPEPFASYVSVTTTPRLPSAGTARLDLHTAPSVPLEPSSASGTCLKGIIRVGLQGRNPVMELASVPLSVGGTTYDYFNVDYVASLTELYVMSSVSCYMRMLQFNGVSNTVSASVWVPAGMTVPIYSATPAAAKTAFAIQTLDEASNPFPLRAYATVMFSGTLAGYVDPTLSPLSYDLVSSELIDQGQVTHYRCTAMNLLVTNMASVLDGAGEIVIGRVPKSVLVANSVRQVMDTIKALPQKNLWSSRNLLDGAYAWYMPDDIESYETQPIQSVSSDNVLVAAVHMANPNAEYRVNATWRMEFYTPAQILTREFTNPWTPTSIAMFKELVSYPATSANLGHLALISTIASGLRSLYSFYSNHSDIINPVVQAAVNHVLPVKDKKKSLKKKNPP
jgi:hypothetical protein